MASWASRCLIASIAVGLIVTASAARQDPAPLAVDSLGRADIGQDSAVFEFTLPTTTTLGEPLILLARLRNRSPEPITADFGLDDQTLFTFRQTKPDGSTVTVQPRPPRNGLAFLSQHQIARRSTYPAALVLDEWLTFTQLGRHQIDVEFRGAVTRLRGGQVAVNRAVSLSVEVKQRNAGRLRRRCEQWLEQAGHQRPGGEARAAEVALSNVIDPVAIPYLEKAIERSNESLFFGTLIKIGGPEVLAVLERLAKSTNQVTAAQARSVLALIREGRG
jgi:hypothetical protein